MSNRTPIQVSFDVKGKLEEIRDQEDMKSLNEVIEFLLEVMEDFDSSEVSAFLHLRKSMFQAFEKGKQVTIDDY